MAHSCAFPFHECHDMNIVASINTVNHVFQGEKGCITREKGIFCHMGARWVPHPCGREPHTMDFMSGSRKKHGCEHQKDG
jgi:hypothetical protein